MDIGLLKRIESLEISVDKLEGKPAKFMYNIEVVFPILIGMTLIVSVIFGCLNTYKYEPLNKEIAGMKAILSYQGKEIRSSARSLREHRHSKSTGKTTIAKDIFKKGNICEQWRNKSRNISFYSDIIEYFEIGAGEAFPSNKMINQFCEEGF